MKAQKNIILALILAACCISFAQARSRDEAKFRRRLEQAATAAAAGTEYASISAAASSIGGQEQAETAATATGEGAATFGVSEAAGQVDACLSGPNQNLSECRTFAPRVRSAVCTNVPPDERWSCQQQANEFFKCDYDFIFVGAYCLESCNRCGDSCTDVRPPDGSACDASKCDSGVYLAKPVCLKTCNRCSPVPAA